MDESLLNTLGNGFTFVRHEDHVLFYKVSTNDLSIPEVTTCIRIDNNLRVKLFHEGSPVPLLEWFRHGWSSKLTKKYISENFPSYVEQLIVNHRTVLSELQQLQFQKSLRCSTNMLRYALTLNYTSHLHTSCCWKNLKCYRFRFWENLHQEKKILLRHWKLLKKMEAFQKMSSSYSMICTCKRVRWRWNGRMNSTRDWSVSWLSAWKTTYHI